MWPKQPGFLRRHAIDDTVAALLRAGLPFAISGVRARAYLERCRSLAASAVSGDPLLAVGLEACRLIALSHVRSADADPGATGAAAVALRDAADALDDDTARGYALLAWGFTHSAPEHAAERARLAEEVLGIATRRDAVVLTMPAYALLLGALLELGEIRALDAELLDARATAGEGVRVDPESPIAWFHCLRSILDGDVADAEQQAEALYAAAEPHGSEALALYATQLGLIRWMQGRTDGVEETLLAARREYPDVYFWTVALARLWLQQGRATSSESLLRTIPRPDALPRDRYWLATVSVLAEIAVFTGSREDADDVRRLLSPYAEHLVAIGAGVAFGGTVALTLGLLEERLGLLDDARRHLELAVETSMRVGAIAWHAEAQLELADFALRHDIAEIPAHDLIAEARAACEARGFAGLAQRAMHRPRVRVLGVFEVISVCGRRAEWNSRKARELLKRLVAARGAALSREVLMDALWPGEPPARLGNRFSVAINVVRRALDPQRIMPTQHYLVTDAESVRLDIDNVDVDLERFLSLAPRDDETSRATARGLYVGEAFSDEPYADWAAALREESSYLRRALG